MLELFSESLKAVNLPSTILLMIVLCYWLISLLGIFDFEMFDSGDVEVDSGDVEAGGSSGGFFASAAEFFHFGDLPVTVIVSFFSLFFWAGTLLSNHYLHNDSMLFALVIYVPAIVVALLVTKVIIKPIAKLYSRLKVDEEGFTGDFSGSVCTVTIASDNGSLGQAEINRNGDSIKVNIQTGPGKSLQRGESALLIEYFSDKGIYLAEPYEVLHAQ